MSHSAKPLRLPNIVSLPIEVHLTILEQIDRPADLNRLSKTCKTLRFVVQPKLYRHLRIQLPPRYTNLTTLEHLLSPMAYGVRFIRGISILANPGCKRDYLNEDWPYPDVECFLLPPPEPESRQQKFCDSMVFNTFIRLLVVKIPANQLLFFHWLHNYQLSIKTIELLADRHGVSMRSLQFDNASHRNDLSRVPATLDTLHASSLDPKNSAASMSGLMVNNWCTLRHLKLGWERRIAQGYWEDNAVMQQHLTDYTYDLETELSSSFQEYGDELEEQLSGSVQGKDLAERESIETKWMFLLDTLHLIGLDINDMTRPEGSLDIPPLFDFTNLKSLCLESCAGLGEGLSRLTGIRENQHHPRMPRLESLALRHEIRLEASSTSIYNYLTAFLISLAGLKHLSVLIEGSDGVCPITAVLKKHGPTLETLVWGERADMEPHLTPSTYLVAAESENLPLKRICLTCPNLRELGIPLKWKLDGKIQVSGVSEKGITTNLMPLKSLKHLKTLNIRNMPPPFEGDIINGPVEAFFIGLAQRLSSQLGKRKKLSKLKPSAVNLIAFGAVTYRDVTFSRSRESEPMDHYLTPRYYHVANTLNVNEDYVPIVTCVGRGASSQAKHYSDDLRVFEPYWLG